VESQREDLLAREQRQPLFLPLQVDEVDQTRDGPNWPYHLILDRKVLHLTALDLVLLEVASQRVDLSPQEQRQPQLLLLKMDEVDQISVLVALVPLPAPAAAQDRPILDP